MAKARIYYTRDKKQVSSQGEYALFDIEPRFYEDTGDWASEGNGSVVHIFKEPLLNLPKLKPGQMMIFEESSPRKAKDGK